MLKQSERKLAIRIFATTIFSVVFLFLPLIGLAFVVSTPTPGITSTPTPAVVACDFEGDPVCGPNQCDVANKKCVTPSITPTPNPTGPSYKCAIDSDCNTGEICDPLLFTCVSKSPSTTPSSGGGIQYKCPANNPLCVPDGPYVNNSLAGSNTVMDLITKVLNALLFFAGIIAVVAIVIGGYQYIAARGNEEMVESGQKTLTNAVIGLIVVIMAYAIVNLLVKSLTGDPTKTTGYIQKQTKIV